MATDYTLLAEQTAEFIKDEPFYVPAMANISALIWDMLPDLNWAGFYFVRDNKLVLGPFQGKVACIHIAKGKGVCGTAWDKDETELVPDVHKFPGHIACDSASNSEIVVPIHDKATGKVIAVLDIDSPRVSRFNEEDKKGLEKVVKVIESGILWN